VNRADRAADAQGVAEVIGRERELDELSRFLDAAASGPILLLLEGEPGIGKTTLLQAGLDAARKRSYRTLACRPAEAEAKLGYAALGDLLEAVPNETFGGLAEPQRRALDVAILRVEPDGDQADRRAASVALLNVIRSLAATGPVLVAIDDAQWLDTASAQAVAFALRRLDRESVGVVVSMRPSATGESVFSVSNPGVRVERLTVDSLPADDLGQVVERQLGVRLSHASMRRLHRASGGNSFYAIEIARASPKSTAVSAEHAMTPPNLRALVAERVARLPADSRRALLVASALSTPDITTIASAMGRSDGRVPALARAEADGVIRVDGGAVTFYAPASRRSLLWRGVAGGKTRAAPSDRRRRRRSGGESEASGARFVRP
jgi:predicted ATPase